MLITKILILLRGVMSPCALYLNFILEEDKVLSQKFFYSITDNENAGSNGFCFFAKTKDKLDIIDFTKKPELAIFLKRKKLSIDYLEKFNGYIFIIYTEGWNRKKKKYHKNLFIAFYNELSEDSIKVIQLSKDPHYEMILFLLSHFLEISAVVIDGTIRLIAYKINFFMSEKKNKDVAFYSKFHCFKYNDSNGLYSYLSELRNFNLLINFPDKKKKKLRNFLLLKYKGETASEDDELKKIIDSSHFFYYMKQPYLEFFKRFHGVVYLVEYNYKIFKTEKEKNDLIRVFDKQDRLKLSLNRLSLLFFDLHRKKILVFNLFTKKDFVFFIELLKFFKSYDEYLKFLYRYSLVTFNKVSKKYKIQETVNSKLLFLSKEDKKTIIRVTDLENLIMFLKYYNIFVHY